MGVAAQAATLRRKPASSRAVGPAVRPAARGPRARDRARPAFEDRAARPVETRGSPGPARCARPIARSDDRAGRQRAQLHAEGGVAGGSPRAARTLVAAAVGRARGGSRGAACSSPITIRSAASRISSRASPEFEGRGEVEQRDQLRHPLEEGRRPRRRRGTRRARCWYWKTTGVSMADGARQRSRAAGVLALHEAADVAARATAAERHGVHDLLHEVHAQAARCGARVTKRSRSTRGTARGSTMLPGVHHLHRNSGAAVLEAQLDLAVGRAAGRRAR